MKTTLFAALLFLAWSCKPNYVCPSYDDSGVKSADEVMKHHDKKRK